MEQSPHTASLDRRKQSHLDDAHGIFPTLDLLPGFIHLTDAQQAFSHANHCFEGFLRIKAGRNTQPFVWIELFCSLSLPSSRWSSPVLFLHSEIPTFP